MTVIDKAVEWAVGIANDPAHGYDQINRQGPDYDCSSLVINAWKRAGLPLSCTYTGNMKQDLLRNGFKVTTSTNRKKGDILLNEKNHTAMMISPTKLVQASCNEKGGITGGEPGDQTGHEINISAYYDFPWDCILRYSNDTHEIEPAENKGAGAGSRDDSKDNHETYVIQKGDTLYGIAEKTGVDVNTLARINEIPDPTLIYPGVVLKSTTTEPEEVVEDCAECRLDFLYEEEDDSIYTVQSGDSLWSIAEKLYGTGFYYTRLMNLNNLTGSVIYPGQKLKTKE